MPTGRAELADADVVLLATPVAQFASIFAAVADRVSPHTIITDAGSTKQNVIAAARRHLGAALPRFVPGHPIAGTEHTGAAAAFATLFRERNVVLTPIAETDPAAAGAHGGSLVGTAAARCACSTPKSTIESSRRSPICPMSSRSRSWTCLRRVPTPTRSFGTRQAAFAISRGSPPARRKCGATSRSRTARRCCGEIDAYRAELDRVAAMVAAGDGAALEAVFARASIARREWGARFAGRPATATDGPRDAIPTDGPGDAIPADGPRDP